VRLIAWLPRATSACARSPAWSSRSSDHSLPSLGRALPCHRGLPRGQPAHPHSRLPADVRPWLESCRFRAIRQSALLRPPTEPVCGQAGRPPDWHQLAGPCAEIHAHHTGEVRAAALRSRGHADHTRANVDARRLGQAATRNESPFRCTGWTVLTFNEEGTVDAPNVLLRASTTASIAP
jgi:hypothetical protein